MSDSSGSSSFRLNLEQQRKRAKELLRAVRAGEAHALERIHDLGTVGSGIADPKLADAQRAIARELRFDDWAQLRHHIIAMTRERDSIEPAVPTSKTEALDADRRTLHIRCGSDLREPLKEARFEGDFYEHSYPYLIGPVREGAACLEQRASFIVSHYCAEDEPSLAYAQVLQDLHESEQRLHDSADYERVVIWSERDCYDQLVLVRLLGHYAAHQRPPSLELINLADFPGAIPFIGLGQLPPEALRMLWSTRTRAMDPQLELGLGTWRALASPDPRGLAAIMRNGTPALPLLAPALHRHLRELPSAGNGLSFTQELALAVLEAEETSLQGLHAQLTYSLDPLPGQGDLQVRNRVLAMEKSNPPLIARKPGKDPPGRVRSAWTDSWTITDTGRAVLEGEVDYLSLAPPSRWVGGVEIGGDNDDWRWDEATLSAGI